jgi:Holliday junction resolvase
MVAYQNVYDSLVEFIAGMDAEKVLAFHAPKELQTRIEMLLEKKQDVSLTLDEKEELERYFILEHIIRLSKSRVRLRLSQL